MWGASNQYHQDAPDSVSSLARARSGGRYRPVQTRLRPRLPSRAQVSLYDAAPRRGQGRQPREPAPVPPRWPTPVSNSTRSRTCCPRLSPPRRYLVSAARRPFLGNGTRSCCSTAARGLPTPVSKAPRGGSVASAALKRASVTFAAAPTPGGLARWSSCNRQGRRERPFARTRASRSPLLSRRHFRLRRVRGHALPLRLCAAQWCRRQDGTPRPGGNAGGTRWGG